MATATIRVDDNILANEVPITSKKSSKVATISKRVDINVLVSKADIISKKSDTNIIQRVYTYLVVSMTADVNSNTNLDKYL